jgi:Zn-dependent protease with chaperone function
MSEQHSNIVKSPNVDELRYLWDQYTYRHELCWSAVYKVAAAVLGLAIIPYAKDGLTKLLGYWMLVPPLIGTFLAGFGVALVNNELDIFANIKFAFHTLENEYLETRMPDAESRRLAIHPMPPAKIRHTRFDNSVHAFMVGLVVLSGANTVFVVTRWIPHVLRMTSRSASPSESTVYLGPFRQLASQ